METGRVQTGRQEERQGLPRCPHFEHDAGRRGLKDFLNPAARQGGPDFTNDGGDVRCGESHGDSLGPLVAAEAVQFAAEPSLTAFFRR